jgi:hypothetical protein
MFDMSEDIDVGWCEIRWVRWVYDESEPVFFAKRSVLSGGVGSCVVSMNNESPPIKLRAERNKFCDNLNMVLLGINDFAFWNRVE